MKLNTIYTEYKATEILKGSPYSFTFFFWLTKLLSLLQRKSALLNRLVHKFYTVAPKVEFVIKNNSGIFAVQAFDDSTTICADYFERDIRDWLLTPPVKQVFVDIGANRGIYSIIAPTKYGYEQVHAFEPNLEMFEVLKRNVALNALTTKVTCHQIAAGKEAATAHFTVDPMHKGGGRIVSETSSETFEVVVEPLDLILAATLPERVSFIKIDTEGFEFAVLAGMHTILKGMPAGACIMVETTQLKEMTTLLADYNFTHQKSSDHDHLFSKHA